jgi:hypothetical protein
MGLRRKIVDPNLDENAHESLHRPGSSGVLTGLFDLVKRRSQFGGLVTWISLVILKTIDLLEREVGFHADFRVEASSDKHMRIHASPIHKCGPVLPEVFDGSALEEVLSTDGVAHRKDKWPMHGSVNEDAVEFISKLDASLDTKNHELWSHAFKRGKLGLREIDHRDSSA